MKKVGISLSICQRLFITDAHLKCETLPPTGRTPGRSLFPADAQVLAHIAVTRGRHSQVGTDGKVLVGACASGVRVRGGEAEEAQGPTRSQKPRQGKDTVRIKELRPRKTWVLSPSQVKSGFPGILSQVHSELSLINTLP